MCILFYGPIIKAIRRTLDGDSSICTINSLDTYCSATENYLIMAELSRQMNETDKI